MGGIMLSLSVSGCTGQQSPRERKAFVAAVENLLTAARFSGSWTVVYSGRRKAAGCSQPLTVGHVERGGLRLSLITGDNGHRYDCWLMLPRDLDVENVRRRLSRSVRRVALARNGRFAS